MNLAMRTSFDGSRVVRSLLEARPGANLGPASGPNLSFRGAITTGSAQPASLHAKPRHSAEIAARLNLLG